MDMHSDVPMVDDMSCCCNLQCFEIYMRFKGFMVTNLITFLNRERMHPLKLQLMLYLVVCENQRGPIVVLNSFSDIVLRTK
jgi:hypothetical protein